MAKRYMTFATCVANFSPICTGNKDIEFTVEVVGVAGRTVFVFGVYFLLEWMVDWTSKQCGH
jgi:hypothetical protein